MYVKKFEGDSLDETLKMVKKDLGPDAIILKTVSNKGLKGAFKKSRIEITAAISEQNYAKKARVDHVLTEDQRDSFYQTPASNINNMINEYNDHAPGASKGGYGNMGLNKVVNTVSKASNKIKNSLDDFLTAGEIREEDKVDRYERVDLASLSRPDEEIIPIEQPIEAIAPQENNYAQKINRNQSASTEVALELRQQLKSQKNQIEILEKKLFDLTQNISLNKTEDDEYEGLKQLRVTLKTLDLSETLVQKILKKAMFELSKEDLEDSELVYEFALRELNNNITTAMPLFSSADVQDKTVVTVLLSDGAAGQSSMGMRLAVLKDNATVIRFREGEIDKRNHDFAARIFKINVIDTNSLSELISHTRQAKEKNKHVILDIKMSNGIQDESRKIIDSLRRSFDAVEVLITISAINSELYNRKILSKYQEISNGVIISYVDQCMNYGALVNVHNAHQNLPLKFFGTGPVIPEDIEAATAERILAGMFQL
jgi:flagellar biosynthesis protein FlhF